MDSFMNMAKQGYQAYNDSQKDVSKTGGAEYNAPSHGQNQQNIGSGVEIDREGAVRHAQENGSGESSLFESALGFISNNKQDHEKPLDEQHVQESHEKAYGQGDASGLSASSMGSAAALQILKQFTSGSSSGSSGGSSGGLGSQSQLISMAMAEATKLFDKSGGAASGNKQDAVNGAAMTVMKLLVQSKFSGGAVGGGNSGGLGSLMGMASKFM